VSATYDVVVCGLGAMGSAALRALSRRGLRVLGLDRFAPPHDLGSSHGLCRIIREAYFEHPAYVPLIQRAYLLWEELERETGRTLRLETGGVMVGPESGVLVSGALRSAREHRLPYELIDAAEIARRVPAFRPDPRMVGVWEPRAGVLFPEAAIAAFLEVARRHGAEIRTNTVALSWESDGAGGYRVRTNAGIVRAERLVLSAGAWLAGLVPDLGLPLTVERLVQFWFDPAGDRERLEPSRIPISIWEHAPGRFFYGFPLLDGRIKLAIHHEGEITDADRLRREVGPDEVEPLRALIRRYVPDADGPLAASAVCMYTNTPDDHFSSTHPLHPARCRERGSATASVRAHGGEIASPPDRGHRALDLGMFRIGRWTGFSV
jgi:sarcosine oxidase